jgi:simple sugar transport system permease protein
MLATIPGSTIHTGLIFGVIACIAGYIWIYHTRQGFAARIIGGNIRAGRIVGLPVERLILGGCFAGGCAAGLGGMIEVAAVQGSVSSDLATGVGYAGVLAAFLARQNPLALVPVAILLGGVDAAGGLLQQQLNTPDSTTLVLRGILFVMLLTSEAMFGGFRLLRPKRHLANSIAPKTITDAGGAK